jgi:hypothetical protein
MGNKISHNFAFNFNIPLYDMYRGIKIASKLTGFV